MAKVRKVNYDPNKVESGGDFVHHPAPALVRVKCTEVDMDFTSSTGNDGVHMQFKIVGSKPPKKGQQWSTLHHYLIFTDEAAWREVEMMEALIGKRVKTYKDTDLVGKICLAKLRQDKYEGETQSKISRLLPLDDDPDDDDDIDPDDNDVDPDDEDDDNEPDEDELPDDYNEWSLTQLRAELEARELETTGRKKALVERLEEDDETAADGADDDDDADPDDEDDDDNETEGEAEEVDFSEWSLKDLRAEAKERGIATRGLDKDAIIEALSDAGDEDDDDDDEDNEDGDNEPADYSELSIRELRAEAKKRGIATRGLDAEALVEALEEDDGDPFGDDDE